MLLRDFIRESSLRLSNSGFLMPMLDVEVITSHFLKVDRSRLPIMDDYFLSDAESESLSKLIDRRMLNEPVAYIIGTKEFYSLQLFVNSSVLIPRPETEELAELAVQSIPQNGLVLDLCTGSGAIAVSLKYYRKDLTVHASDISEQALAVAKANADNLVDSGITFIHGDLFGTIPKVKYDCIISNPPYIGINEKHLMTAEVAYEPSLALFSDSDGSALTMSIIDESLNYLKHGGLLMLETNPEFAEKLFDHALKKGFTGYVKNDYSGKKRFIIFQKADDVF